MGDLSDLKEVFELILLGKIQLYAGNGRTLGKDNENFLLKIHKLESYLFYIFLFKTSPMSPFKSPNFKAPNDIDTYMN